MILCYNLSSVQFSSVQWSFASTNLHSKTVRAGELSYCPIFGKLVMHMFKQFYVQYANGCRTMYCQTVQYLDSVVSNSPMVGLCCFQLSDGLWAECPTVQWSDCAFFNCPIYGRTVLCPTFQRSDNTVSNCQMVGQRCAVQWLVNAESNCPMAGQLSVQLSNG